MNHIAFLSMLAWLNATIAWMTGRVGYPHVSWGVRYEQSRSFSFELFEALTQFGQFATFTNYD